MKTNPKIILLLLALSQFLVVLDSAIVNVALPAIKEALHFDTASLQWVITAYILTFGGFLMLGGRMADLFGRRKILVYGIIGFTVLSLLIGLAPNSTSLIVLRALQGLAGAFMSPAALSILLTTFKEGEERNKALSVWSVVASGGAAAGVFLGGLITETLGWQWNFFVNVPIGIIAAWGVLKYVPEHIKEASDKKLDLPGAALVTLGLMALVYGLTQAPEAGWGSWHTIAPLIASVGLLAAFVWNESRAPHPLVPLSIFKIRNVVGGNLVMLPIVAGGLGSFFFCSLYVQNVLGYSPIMSGLAFLPIPIIIGLVSTRAPRLLGKFGFKKMLLAGTTFVGLGMLNMGFLTESSSYFVNLLPGFVLLGVGMGLSFVAVTVAATAGVPGQQAGLASGLINTSNQVGAALGIAVLAVIAAGVTTNALAAGNISETAAALLGYKYSFFTAAGLLAIALLVTIFVIREPKNGAKLANDAPISTH
jgi:EmrB/QacA subfamily drug resistance transporter